MLKMKIALFFAYTVASTLAFYQGPHGSTRCIWNVNTEEHHAHILSNYLKLWGGDLSVLNQTLSPTVALQIDRFPRSTNCSSGLGSQPIVIDSSAAFGEFVSSTHLGFAKYGFTSNFWFGQENKVVVRWSLDAIIGQDFTKLPTTLKPGDHLTYNGTDILVLDKCTGLADEIYSAQDLMTLFHNLGLTSVTV